MAKSLDDFNSRLRKQEQEANAKINNIQNQDYSAWEGQTTAKYDPVADQNSFQRGLMAGAEGLKTTWEGAKAAGNALIEDEPSLYRNLSAAETHSRNAQRIGPTVNDIDEVDSVAKLTSFAAGAVAQAIPSITSMAASGGISGIAAKGLIKALGKKALKDASKKYTKRAAASGAFGTGYTQMVGEQFSALGNDPNIRAGAEQVANQQDRLSAFEGGNSGFVSRVIDGDTVELTQDDGTKRKLRLGNINTADVGQEGKDEATRRLSDLVSGKRLFFNTGNTSYDRDVATLYSEDSEDSINNRMLSIGAAGIDDRYHARDYQYGLSREGRGIEGALPQYSDHTSTAPMSANRLAMQDQKADRVGDPAVSQTGKPLSFKQLAGLALTGSVPAAALDILPVMRVFKKFGLGEAADLAAGEWYSRMAKEGVKGALSEGATEAGQQAIQRSVLAFADQNKEILGEEGMKELRNAAAMGFFGGAPFGALGGIPGAKNETGGGETDNPDGKDKFDIEAEQQLSEQIKNDPLMKDMYLSDEMPAIDEADDSGTDANGLDYNEYQQMGEIDTGVPERRRAEYKSKVLEGKSDDYINTVNDLIINSGISVRGNEELSKYNPSRTPMTQSTAEKKAKVSNKSNTDLVATQKRMLGELREATKRIEQAEKQSGKAFSGNQLLQMLPPEVANIIEEKSNGDFSAESIKTSVARVLYGLSTEDVSQKAIPFGEKVQQVAAEKFKDPEQQQQFVKDVANELFARKKNVKGTSEVAKTLGDPIAFLNMYDTVNRDAVDISVDEDVDTTPTPFSIEKLTATRDESGNKVFPLLARADRTKPGDRHLPITIGSQKFYMDLQGLQRLGAKQKGGSTDERSGITARKIGENLSLAIASLAVENNADLSSISQFFDTRNKTNDGKVVYQSGKGKDQVTITLGQVKQAMDVNRDPLERSEFLKRVNVARNIKDEFKRKQAFKKIGEEYLSAMGIYKERDQVAENIGETEAKAEPLKPIQLDEAGFTTTAVGDSSLELRKAPGDPTLKNLRDALFARKEELESLPDDPIVQQQLSDIDDQINELMDYEYQDTPKVEREKVSPEEAAIRNKQKKQSKVRDEKIEKVIADRARKESKNPTTTSREKRDATVAKRAKEVKSANARFDSAQMNSLYDWINGVFERAGIKDMFANSPLGEVKQRQQRNRLTKISTEWLARLNIAKSVEVISESDAISYLKAQIKAEKAKNEPNSPKKDPRKVDPENDSLLTAVGKLGGISKEEMIENGVDPEDMKGHGWDATHTAFHNGDGSSSLDGMRETLAGYGYQYDTLNDLLNAINKELSGDNQYTQSGYELMERQARERDADEAPMSALEKRLDRLERGTQLGFVTPDGKIYINPRLKPEQQVQVLAHEIGHMVKDTYYDNASDKTKAALQAAWEKHLETNSGSISEALAQQKPPTVAELFKNEDRELTESDKEYQLSFDEWMADNVGRWLTSNEQAKSVVDKFYVKVGKALRKLFNGLVKQHYKANKSVVAFVEDLWLSTENVDVSAEVVADHVNEAFRLTTDKDLDKQILAAMMNVFKTTLDPQQLAQARGFIRSAMLISQELTNGNPATEELAFRVAYAVMLTPEQRRILDRALNATHVKNQLIRKLGRQYAGTIRNNNEAAMGFAYSLWIRGEIKLGPQTETVFQKLLEKAARVMGIVRDHERADMLIQQMRDSTAVIANRSSEFRQLRVPNQLKDTKIRKTAALLREFGEGSVGQVFSKLISSASTQMRNTKNSALVGLDRMLFNSSHDDLIGSPESLFASKERINGHYKSRIDKLFHGKDAEFISKVQHGLHRKQRSVERDVAKVQDEVRKILDDMYDYLKEQGVQIGHRGEYFPWVFDFDTLLKREHDFIGILAQEKYDQYISGKWEKNPKTGRMELVKGPGFKTQEERLNAAKKFYDAIMRNAGDGDHIAELDMSRDTHTPFFAAHDERILSFLEDDIDQLADFFEQDLGTTLYRYVDQSVKRGEFAKRFGTYGHKLQSILDEARRLGATEEDIDRAKIYTQAMMGTLGADINPKILQAQGVVMVYQNLRVLAFATLSSLIDPIGIAVRSGDLSIAGKAYAAGLRSIAAKLQGKEAKPMAESIAELIGAVELKGTVDSLAYEFGGTYMQGTARKINEGFFKYSGLTAFTRWTRVMATEGALQFIKYHTQEGNKHSERYLDQLGITKEDIQLDENGRVKIMSAEEHQLIQDQYNQILRENRRGEGKREIDKSSYQAWLKNGTQYDDQGNYIGLNSAEVHSRFMAMDWSQVQDKVLDQQINLKKSRIESLKQYLDQNPPGMLDADSQKDYNRKMAQLTYMESEAAHLRKERDIRKLATSEKESKLQELRTKLEADDRVKAALNRFVDESILRPNAAQRPIWASDPHWMLIFHLKSFTYSMYERIIKRSFNEAAAHGNYTPLAMMSMYVPVMIAADMLRAGIKGEEDDEEKDALDYVFNGIERAGLLGLGSFAVSVGGDVERDNLPGSSLLGPTAEQILGLFEAWLNEERGDMGYQVAKGLPLQNLIVPVTNNYIMD